MRNAIADILRGVLARAEIARRLNDDGFRTRQGNPWNGDTLRQYLLSPWVRGVCVYTGKHVPEGVTPPDEVTGTNFVPLVSPREWEALKLALAPGPDKGGHFSRDDPQHLLTGFAYCGRILDATDARGVCGTCGQRPGLTANGKLKNHDPAHGGWGGSKAARCTGSGTAPGKVIPHPREGQVCGARLTNRRGTSNGQPVYCCPAYPRGCGKVARNEEETDRWVKINLFWWLSGPEGAYDLSAAGTQTEDLAISSLYTEQETDRKKLARLHSDWADRPLESTWRREDYEQQGRDIEDRMARREALLDRQAQHKRAEVIPERGAELVRVWEEKWSLSRRRNALAMFLGRVDVLSCRLGPIPFDPSKVIVTPLREWAKDAPPGSLDVPAAKIAFTDPRIDRVPRDRVRRSTPARDRILKWLESHPRDDLSAMDVMTYGLADARDKKAAYLLLWRMAKTGELGVTQEGVRGLLAPRFGLPDDPRTDRPVPDEERILDWLGDNRGRDLSPTDAMKLGLTGDRNAAAARKLFVRMAGRGNLAVTRPGVRAHSDTRYGLPVS